MRLAISLMLSSLVLSQDENIEQLLWNGGKSLLEFDAAVIQKEAEFGGSLLTAGGDALNSLVNGDGSKNGEALNSLVHADGSENVATDKPATEDTTALTTDSGNSVEPTYKLHAISGSGSDSTAEPVAGKTVEPATDGENTVDQTNGFLEIPDEVTPKPPGNLLGDQTQPDKPPDLDLSGIGDAVPIKTSLDHGCDSTNSKASDADSSCDQPIPRIIWPIQCEDSTNIQEMLINAGVESDHIRTSEDDCGTFFLTAPMTEEQVGRVLEIAKDAIKAVVTDDHIISDGLLASPRPARRKKNRREVARIITVKQAPYHLHIISATGGTESDYVYFENAGESIEGFMLVLADERMRSTHREFTTENIIKARASALAPVGWRSEADHETPIPGSALSLVSVVGGEKYGVIKKASLTLITMAPMTSSFLSGLTILRSILQGQLRSNDPKRARTVVMTSVGFKSLDERLNEEAALTLITDLINRYQVVFICAAGDIKVDLDGTRVTEPYQWPANWAARQDSPPIITVGGVDLGDGRVADGESRHFPMPGSVSGDMVELYAPYYVEAIFGDNALITGGTAYSAGLAMGLAMDFLSRPGVREEQNLIQNEQGVASISTAVKLRDYMFRLSFARVPGGPNVIWNGLRDEEAPPP